MNERTAPAGTTDGPTPLNPTEFPHNGRAAGDGLPVASHEEGAARLRDEFAARVSSAWAKFSSAIDQMHLGADAMQDDGRPPSYRLVLALGDCQREFLRLRLDLTRRAEALGLRVPPTDTIAGIGDLVKLFDTPDLGQTQSAPVEYPVEPPEPWLAVPESLVTTPDVVPPALTPEIRTQLPEEEPATALEPVEDVGPVPEKEQPLPENEPLIEATRRAALSAIDTCLRLVTRDGSELTSLDECHAQARSLHSSIADSPPTELPVEASQLEAGEHAINALLTVLGGVESMSDAQWAVLHARVSESYGRQLAVAAARNRLVLTPIRSD